tara:strand:+ start:61 stop:924 length:864 start_codon:yes stop_codon:yes gene_type:complete
MKWRSCDPNYGAFQERCLVPWQHAVPIPEGISWNEAAALPVSVEVPLNAWEFMGIPRMKATCLRPESKASTKIDATCRKQVENQEKREALLVWGASSSVGSMGVQSARLLRDDPSSSFSAVYATAGFVNKDYVASLGADRVFNYTDPSVVGAIISAAKEDGLVIRYCFLATGLLEPCQAVLKSFLGGNTDCYKTDRAKIASAPIVPLNAELIDRMETVFVVPPSVEKRRLEHFQYVSTWTNMNLARRTIRPSPEPRVVGKGLEGINAGLEILRRGVSCAKLVIEVGE